ncbi:DNA recombination protein RmuC [Jannaschia seosinensis]|uniref:DNA recombination protein RmuC homolog n=1 Tax=Jannaschia seosinensis TaxID=313367 RepID=A0A0M7B3Q6_9RHOB|nr:DNA recombination protein RmuC [Jannaschia seosinensis]CUH08973.1 DNA recombination protein RmuC [Jannaschia seosinensis]
MSDALTALFDASPFLGGMRGRLLVAPEAAILALAVLALLVPVLAVLWRRTAPDRARCAALADALSDRDTQLAEADRQATSDREELQALGREGVRLSTQIEGLEARLDEAAAERRDIATDLKAAHEEIRRLTATNEGLTARLQGASEKHEADVSLLRDLRTEMTNHFRTLSADTLKDQGERFGALNRERVDALLKPMREQVDHFQRELRDAHQGAAKDRERLKTEIEALSRRSEEVGRDAVALTRALKGEKQRQGAWGEMVLERLLEDCGLTEGREYDVQATFRREDDTRGRPDVIVRLPSSRAVVIDAKVSLNAYEAAVNAEDPAEREANLRAHVAALRKHVTDLEGRDYAAHVDGSVDYVVMFLPIEGALAAALQEQPELTSWAMSRGIAIAAPMTLMPLLRTVEHIWTVEQRQRNAEEIAARAGLLHDKMAGVVDAFGKVGDHLARAQAEHGNALDRLTRGNGNVLGQFDKLRRLGARTSKELGTTFDTDDAPALPDAAAE